MSPDEILETFDLLSDWDQRYEFIAELGGQLPLMPAEEKTDANLVRGCNTPAWLTGSLTGSPPVMDYRADADGPLVRGLVALLLAPFQGKPPQEVAETDAAGYIDALGLEQHLSPTRRVGMHVFIERVKAIARAFVDKS